MKFPKTYKLLSNNIFSYNEYSLVPIRYEHRYEIMSWRNQQIYHLRQNKLLTKSDQDRYFKNVVSKIFNEKKPSNILFSYMFKNKCIGYGGLVHIDWENKNAEISFIMETELEKDFFSFHWQIFLKQIEKVAFQELGFKKIYTYAFDLRPHLYDAIEKAGMVKEAELKEHRIINNEYRSVVIHSKYNGK